jgi:hypothetical protein
MTYYESAEGQTMTFERVELEFKRHGQTQEDLEEFLDEFGLRPLFDAQDVLEWLGY